MTNRRLARRAHNAQKKKLKLAKKMSLKESEQATAKLQTKKTKRKADKRAVQVNPIDALRKERSVVLKKHAKERVALRDHVRELTERRNRIKKGVNAKAERRELGKYIRQLREELMKRHKEERDAIETQLEKIMGDAREKRYHHFHRSKEASHTMNDNNNNNNLWEDINDDDDDDNQNDEQSLDELQDMFAHLTT